MYQNSAWGAIEEVHDRPMEIEGGGLWMELEGESASFSKQAPNGWDVCQTTDGTAGRGGGVAQIRHYHNHHRRITAF